jgi:hypothetical protein
MSCGKQMKWNISIKITPANFYFGNRRFPLLRFRSALHCGYSGITVEWKYWMFSRIFCFWLSRTWPFTFLHGSGQKISHLECQWYHYNHNAKRYENVIRGIVYSNLFLPAISKIWPAFGHWQPAISTGQSRKQGSAILGEETFRKPLLHIQSALA